MPVKNNGPGGNGRASATRKSKVEPEYPQWAESKMRAIENRRLKELQAVVRDSMPEILAIVADEMDTASESIRKDGYSDMVRRIQNRFRIIELGYSIVLVAKRIGDTVPVVMRTYAHLYPNKQQELVSKLEAIGSPTSNNDDSDLMSLG